MSEKYVNINDLSEKNINDLSEKIAGAILAFNVIGREFDYDNVLVNQHINSHYDEIDQKILWFAGIYMKYCLKQRDAFSKGMSVKFSESELLDIVRKDLSVASRFQDIREWDDSISIQDLLDIAIERKTFNSELEAKCMLELFLCAHVVICKDLGLSLDEVLSKRVFH